MTDEQADVLVSEIGRLIQEDVRIESADLRFSACITDEMVWEIYTSAGSTFGFPIYGKTKADVATNYLDHLIYVYRNFLGKDAPSRPVLKERRKRAGELGSSLVLASLGALREQYIGDTGASDDR